MIQLFELLGADDRRYSQYCWRARMALKHKALEFETTPIRLTDKSAIAFADSTSVPVIVDGDAVHADSWDIAAYLETAYPDAPPLFGGGIGLGLTRFVNSWCDRAVNVALGSLIARDVLDATHPDDRDYLRKSIEKLYGRTLEEVQEGREGRVRGLYRTLDPIRGSLRKGQSYVCGEAPGYADYVVFSQFQWARIVSPFKLLDADDPVFAWRERMLDLFDGYARQTVAHDIAA